MQQGPSGMPFGGGMPQRGFADGGGTDYGMLAKRSEMQELGNLLPSAEAGNPLASTVLHDVGGSLPMQGGGDIPSPTFPGSSPPPIGGPTPIPSMQLQPGGGKSGPYGQFMMMQSPSMGSQSQSGGVGQAIGMAEKVLPMLAMMREGGIVNPFAAGEGYADGGGEDTDINAYNDQSQPMWKRVGLQSDPDAMPPEITAGKSQVDPNSPTLVGGPSHVGFADESPTGGFQGRPQPPTPFGGGPRPYAMSPSQAPYPDALQRDWGQNATRSPWMALVKAGAQMMQTRGPIGSVIGAGLGAGAGELESQRKELRSEEDINQKAEHLAQQAQFHIDEYTKTKPHEAAEERLHEEQLAQQRQFHNVPVGYRQTKEGLEPIPGGPADPETVGSLAMAKMQGGLMNDDALNLAVDRIHSGDPSALQNLGRGAQTGINLTRIQNRLAERAKAEGWTGADLAAARASFTSQAAAARVAATREANVEASVEEAKNTFPLALKASMAVPRTNFVPLNKLTQAVAAGTASPEQRAFVVANRGAITAYAQAMSRIGVTSVHAQQAAEDLLLTADGHDAYAAGIHQMEQEMDAAKIAPEIVRQHILARISGKGAPAPTTMEGAAAQRGQQPATPAPQTGAPAGIPQGSVHGTKAGKPGWRTPDGQFIVD
jgi:hypothetical protein